MPDQFRWADDPAQTERGQRMRFRQARHDDSALGHAGERPGAGMRADKGEILIDFVRQQPEIVLAA